MTPTQPLLDRILECEQTISALREENEHLRRAALDFGALAERLNTALTVERHATAQWTSGTRHEPDAKRLRARGAKTAPTAGAAASGH